MNDRLKQLEDIENRLYLKIEATNQRRAEEDEQLQFRRQEEDRDFLETLRERDQEEDVSKLHSQTRRFTIEWMLRSSVEDGEPSLGPPSVIVLKTLVIVKAKILQVPTMDRSQEAK